MKKVLRAIRNKARYPSIRMRFFLFYASAFVLAISICLGLFFTVYTIRLDEQTRNLLRQTGETTNLVLDSLIGTANLSSRMFIASDVVRTALKDPLSYTNCTSLYSFFNSIMDSNIYINAIALYDNNGTPFTIGLQEADIVKVEEAYWYPYVTSLQGSYLLTTNVQDMVYRQEPIRYIAFIRKIHDLDTLEPLGTLILYIRLQSLEQSINASQTTDPPVYFLYMNARKQSLVKSSFFKEHPEIITAAERMPVNEVRIRNVKGHRYAMMRMFRNGVFQQISVMPVEPNRTLQVFYTLALTMIILLCIGWLVMGLFMYSRLIGQPLHKLMEAMHDAEKEGFLVPVHVSDGSDEIGALQGEYNRLIDTIDRLFHRLMDEQKQTHQMELNLLHEQIKPHFLYNTIDSIKGLILMEENNKAYQAMKALGQYYRLSLSHGDEVIPFGDEMDIVRSYVKIMQLRYASQFTVEYDIEEGIQEEIVLKLVLQPLIENAIKHGIMPANQGEGHVRIGAHRVESLLCVTIEDNGAGMTKEQIDRILLGDQQQAAGFGLQGTIARLRLFYGKQEIISIQSEKGSGTRICLSLPRLFQGEQRGGFIDV